MASIKLDVSNVLRRFKKVSSGLDDMSPVFRQIAVLEQGQTLMRFRTEKDPDGKRWPDSKTIRRDANAARDGRFTRENAWNYVLKSNFHAVPPGWHWFSRARGDKVLTDTGTLRRSIGIAYGKDYAIVGTNIEYAEKHQEGIGVKRRAFLGINAQTNKNIEEAFEAYFKGLLK
jgi:phage gpG-like protein